MSDELSDDPAIRTEQVIRNKNVQAKNAIKHYFRNQDDSDKPLDFTCECSDPDCGKHVKASIDTYEATHKRKDRFTISKGHETSKIEKIVEKKPGFNVVEKNKLKPE